MILNIFILGLLTIYDMCKAVDRRMVMTDVKVLEKHGKSGDWWLEVEALMPAYRISSLQRSLPAIGRVREQAQEQAVGRPL